MLANPDTTTEVRDPRDMDLFEDYKVVSGAGHLIIANYPFNGRCVIVRDEMTDLNGDIVLRHGYVSAGNLLPEEGGALGFSGNLYVVKIFDSEEGDRVGQFYLVDPRENFQATLVQRS